MHSRTDVDAVTGERTITKGDPRPGGGLRAHGRFDAGTLRLGHSPARRALPGTASQIMPAGTAARCRGLAGGRDDSCALLARRHGFD
jgi:hypothetical protein